MGFSYVSVEEAIASDGMRMVVVGGLPSPWGEAAKGIFHIKKIEWLAVRLVYDSAALKDWIGQRTGPVAVYYDEKPRSVWADILLLTERVAPDTPLLPADAAERAMVFGLAHELCGEDGLGWSRRLQLIHAAFEGQGGFAMPVAKYLARKYGYTPEDGVAAKVRVARLLAMLADRLKAQHEAGSAYVVGDALSAADVYCATFAGMFGPLPQDVCAMDPAMRSAFETLDDTTQSALDPIVFEHRDMMYARYLELPLTL